MKIIPFLFVCFCLHGQQMRFYGKDTLTSITYIGICKDSLTKITCDSDSKINGIQIGFENGDIETLPHLKYNEFFVSEKILQKLKNNKFDVLFFDSDNPFTCINIKTKDFFIKNLKP